MGSVSSIWVPLVLVSMVLLIGAMYVGLCIWCVMSKVINKKKEKDERGRGCGGEVEKKQAKD